MSYLKHLVHEGFRSLPEAIGEEKGMARKLKLLGIYSLIALIFSLIMGAEAIRAAYRKKYGIDRERGAKAILAFLFFAGVAVLSFAAMNDPEEYNFIPEKYPIGRPGSDMNFITGMLFGMLALYILTKTIIYWTKTAQKKISPDSEGTSLLAQYSFFKSYNTKDLFFKAEPLITIAIGLVYCIFDLIGGVPLVFCGIAVWGNYLYEGIEEGGIKKDVANMNQHILKRKTFTEVNSES